MKLISYHGSWLICNSPPLFSSNQSASFGSWVRFHRSNVFGSRPVSDPCILTGSVLCDDRLERKGRRVDMKRQDIWFHFLDQNMAKNNSLFCTLSVFAIVHRYISMHFVELLCDTPEVLQLLDAFLLQHTIIRSSLTLEFLISHVKFIMTRILIDCFLSKLQLLTSFFKLTALSEVLFVLFSLPFVPRERQ